MSKNKCPLGFPTCKCPGQPSHCALCIGCQCRGKYPHLCRGRRGAHTYVTIAQRERLDAIARARGNFHTGPFKAEPDHSPLLEEIISEWLNNHP